MQGALVKRALGVETRASRDAEGARERVFSRRSQDSDAHVLVDKTLTVKKCDNHREGIWALYDRTAMLAYWGITISALAFFAALSEESGTAPNLLFHSARVRRRRDVLSVAASALVEFHTGSASQIRPSGRPNAPSSRSRAGARASARARS